MTILSGFRSNTGGEETRARRGSPARTPSPSLPLAVAITVGVALSLAGYLVAGHLESSAARRAFEAVASRQANLLQGAITMNLEVLASVARLFGAKNAVEREEFRAYTDLVFRTHPGMLTLAWLPRVPAAERAAFEHAARASGLAGYVVSERVPGGGLVPAHPRAEYFPHHYVATVAPEQARNLIGFDAASNPIRSRAMEDARDKSAQVAIAPIRLLQGAGNDHALLVFHPIYDAAATGATVEARRRALAGYLLGVFRVGELLTAALAQTPNPGAVDIRVLENDALLGERELFRRAGGARRTPQAAPATAAGSEGPRAISKLDVAGRVWSVEIRPGPALRVGEYAWTPPAALVIGLLLTGILAIYLRAILGRNALVTRLVAERTNELSRTNLALKDEIREREKAEALLRAATEAAEVANEGKSVFLANMSHELRTPLNAIIGFSEMMQAELFGELGNDRYREYARDVNQSGRHLLDVINTMLDVSKIEAGKFQLLESEVDVAATIRDAIGMVRETVRAASLRLEARIPEDLPWLYADQRSLKQMLLNLLSNAAKFTPEGGQVTVAAQVDHSGELVLSVSDTGIGIAAQNIPKALALFEQIGSLETRKHPGTGLGLPLVKVLAEMHGGALELESEVDVGTTVTLRFPSARVLYDAAGPAGGGELEAAN